MDKGLFQSGMGNTWNVGQALLYHFDFSFHIKDNPFEFFE